MAKRPPIPAGLERQVLIESGHRCAIHTCRQHPVEIAHITAWSRCKAHEFHNLICLCPTCHTRYDNGQIDRQSMLVYKQSAWWRNSRYGDLERRLLAQFVRDGTDQVWVLSALELLLSQLLEDGIIVEADRTKPEGLSETLGQTLYKLTGNGHELAAFLRSQNADPFGV
jgi:hypothetical protein